MRDDFIWEGWCECGDRLHQVLLSQFDDDDPTLEVCVATGRGSFWYRLRHAAAYLFRAKPVIYESVVLYRPQIQSLREALAKMPEGKSS